MRKKELEKTMTHRKTFFESHPKTTLAILNGLILVVLMLVFNLKWLNSDGAQGQKISPKTLALQAYYGAIIDNNVGRFIKLREFEPNQIKQDRPSRDYLANLDGDYLERKWYQIATDENGFILGAKPHHVEPDLKIVFLGGSTTECLFVDEDKRFVSKVRDSLEEQTSKKINTYNGGVSANESMHSTNIFLNKVLKMNPDIVVLMHNINDLVVLRSQGGYHYSDSRKSHLQTSQNVFTQVELPASDKRLSDEQIKRAFASNLSMFVSIAKHQGITPVLMTQANRVDDDALYHQLNEVILEVGSQAEITVVDLANQIPANPEFIYDHYHYTGAGSLLAAQHISEALLELISEDTLG